MSPDQVNQNSNLKHFNKYSILNHCQHFHFSSQIAKYSNKVVNFPVFHGSLIGWETHTHSILSSSHCLECQYGIMAYRSRYMLMVGGGWWGRGFQGEEWTTTWHQILFFIRLSHSNHNHLTCMQSHIQSEATDQSYQGPCTPLTPLLLWSYLIPV